MTDQCQNCGSQLEEGAVVCVQCGQATDVPALSISFASASAPPPTLAGNEPQATAPLFSEIAVSADRGLTGIGGWLILPAIGIAVSPFFSVHGIYTDLNVLFNSRYEGALGAHPGLEALIVFELASNLLLLVILVTLNILFYKRKRKFPALMITFLAVQAVLVLIEYIAALPFDHNTSFTESIRALSSCALWIPYFLMSRRVKLTFVR